MELNGNRSKRVDTDAIQFIETIVDADVKRSLDKRMESVE